MIRGFYVDRYSLVSADVNSLVNLAEPEADEVDVFMPLRNAESYVTSKESPSHGRSERWFLGKPLQSNVEHVVFDAATSSQLQNAAILVSEECFVKDEEGLLCVGDVAGYGSALQYARVNMRAFTMSTEEICQAFRSSIVGEFEDLACRMGTTQLQLAGDGLMAAFPRRANGDLDKTDEEAGRRLGSNPGSTGVTE